METKVVEAAEKNPTYVEPDETDILYFGAKEVVEAEKEHIRQNRAHGERSKIEDNLTGIALSGGGIRSASFSLGVLQALAYNQLLERMDYLSTVSGGGYIGSSITWLLSKDWKDKDEQTIHYGVRRGDFPYGTFPMSGDAPDVTAANRDKLSGDANRLYQGRLLRFLRQHAKYLTPGDGIDITSFIAVILRGTLLSFLVYLSILVLIFTCLNQISFFNPLTLFQIGSYTIKWNLALIIASGTAILFFAGALIYAASTYWPFGRARVHSGRAKHDRDAYVWRRRYEQIAGFLLKMIILTTILGIIPHVYKLITWTDYKAVVGFGSTLLGFASGIGAFIKTSSTKKGKIPMGLLVGIATIALLFGLLLLAYSITLRMSSAQPALIAVAAALLLLGWFANLNYNSVHRYYRDRLMESFMPDVKEAVKPDCAGSLASKEADKTRLHDMCGINEQNPGLGGNPTPYHIINTNIILVSSRKPKFRGRGGDNFILTPWYCGSNATGWRSTLEFMTGRMTLATAMAVSGAAVNPSTGVGGQGVTRQVFLSMLMVLLNIRLGYWATNPRPAAEPPSFWSPNLLLPGLWELMFRNRLNENRGFVQLSDGGHFENLGMYELIRRRLRLIIVCDGAADPNFAFGDLANAMEKVRVDFGVLINIRSGEIGKLVPRKKSDDKDDPNALKYAEQGFLIADIVYPDNETGTLIYLKTTFFRELSADLYGYKKDHPEFPDEPTSDQFFNESQFEAYRELGFQTAWQMMNNPQAVDLIKKIFSNMSADIHIEEEEQIAEEQTEEGYADEALGDQDV